MFTTLILGVQNVEGKRGSAVMKLDVEFFKADSHRAKTARNHMSFTFIFYFFTEFTYSSSAPTIIFKIVFVKAYDRPNGRFINRQEKVKQRLFYRDGLC